MPALKRLYTENTLLTLNIRTYSLLNILKISSGHSYYLSMCLNIAVCMANLVDTDQAPRLAASDLGQHCLLRTVRPKNSDKYGSNSHITH